jgi:rubrerythrin
MEAIKPKTKIEFKLMLKEDWEKAKLNPILWKENFVICNVCDKRISGRHFINGFIHENVEFVNLCPNCHNSYGRGLGEETGKLYTRLVTGKWIKTF